MTGADHILPFQLDGLDVRGRVAMLGPAIDTILRRHDHSDVVSRRLGEIVLVAALLGTALKIEGRFTVQAQGDGPLSLLVADHDGAGVLRGYAQVDEERVSALGEGPKLADLMGKGYLAMTIDQGPDTERYQGITALEGESLAAAAEGFFRSSDQIPTALRLAVARTGGGGAWKAGGILLQHLPPGGPAPLESESDSENWRRPAILLASLGEGELVDPRLSAEDVLTRLFHEEATRVFASRPLEAGCRCSVERIRSVLLSFPREEWSDMTEDGRIAVTCEFCAARYAFDPDTLDPIPDPASPPEASTTADSPH